MKPITDEILAFMEIMENPVAVENGDGTCDIESDSGDVENIDEDSLEDYLQHSRYGDNIQHGVLRHKRKFEVKDGVLYVQ